MENVVYLEISKRYNDFGQILNPKDTKGYCSRTSEKFRLFQILAIIMNFGGNGKCQMLRHWIIRTSLMANNNVECS